MFYVKSYGKFFLNIFEKNHKNLQICTKLITSKIKRLHKFWDPCYISFWGITTINFSLKQKITDLWQKKCSGSKNFKIRNIRYLYE